MSGSTTTNPNLYAVQQIRRMRGGSQSQLMRASDGGFYVVKFQNNPQDIRVLANEFLATRLGLWLGLPMPEVSVIEVSDWLVANTPDLRIDLAGVATPCSTGLQLASRYVADPVQEMVFDYLPENVMLEKTQNMADFAAVLAFDKWTGNADGRQAVFTKKVRARKYRATFIDQGYCFNAGQWDFPDSPLRGVYARNCVYEKVAGWESFEPALSRLEQIDSAELWQLAQGMPEEWYQHDAQALARLIGTLYQRRLLVRDLIIAFRNSSRNPFPNWKD
ncbi:MAG TPA: HipA family kinase [Candidatus Angelobacter sp.]|nr:HipA family kinase [Candidatus Angelobacter sp.]